MVVQTLPGLAQSWCHALPAAWDVQCRRAWSRNCCDFTVTCQGRQAWVEEWQVWQAGAPSLSNLGITRHWLQALPWRVRVSRCGFSERLLTDCCHTLRFTSLPHGGGEEELGHGTVFPLSSSHCKQWGCLSLSTRLSLFKRCPVASFPEKAMTKDSRESGMPVASGSKQGFQSLQIWACVLTWSLDGHGCLFLS